jgi:hypothetical protein
LSAIAFRIHANNFIKRFSFILIIIGVFCIIGLMATDVSNTRLLLTLSILTVLMAIYFISPPSAIFSLLLFLPFLGLIRRILIPLVGWNSLDTLVVLGPVFVLLLSFLWFLRKYIQRETILNDTRLFQMIRWLVLIDLLQVFNPMQGSFLVGLSGVIFYMVPVLYMILGREYLDEKWIKRIFFLVFVIGILVACYGFKQYWLGYSSFEMDWIDLSGYVALMVAAVIRPISTFTNATEYSHYLGLAIIVGWGYFLRGSSKVKVASLICVVLMYWALFIESARSAIVTYTIALFLMTILSAKKKSSRVLLLFFAVFGVAGLFYGMTKLDTSNDLISHSVSGLTDPFGEESTLPGHIELMFSGFIEGLKNPLGYGLGSTTIAAGKLGGSIQFGTEIDFSNNFLATGIIGGLLYLFIFVNAMWIGIRYANGGNAVQLAILGIMVGETLQWLMGGHYSVVAILWIAVGFLDKTAFISERTVGR